jgi:saccharopine dehydrogenase (NAD+, L-lysine-forming)
MARFYKLERDTLDTVAERKEGEQSDMFRDFLFRVTKQTNNCIIKEEKRNMSRVLMIGAGGVATVAAFKIAQNPDVFTEFMIASRRKEKCDKLVADIHAKGYNIDIKTAQVDADDVEQLKALFADYQPELVINLALPYQDLTIMEACLACGCSYLDTANYEPKDEAHFEYSWQWAYRERFRQAGLTAIL